MTVRASESDPFVHPTAVVDPGAHLESGARIWHFCHVMSGARIGKDAMLGQGCFVASGVSIGARSRIQNHVSVFEGVEIDDDVFIGPSVVFTNVEKPRAFLKQEYGRTLVRHGATIGANATILPGIEIGEYAFVGAGALVRENVPSYALVVGVPARQIGWVGKCAEKLVFEDGVGVCPVTGDRFRLEPGGLVPESGRR
jgi:UDP-2-acetamido-3-amino-2,3-dideoxy-glucuronate N-acetyltransferase